jgi:hypothetical protein
MKKKTKKAKKLNPKQVFIVRSVTRAEVAETFNDIIECNALKLTNFTDTDPRLTDEVCERVADGTDSAICEVDEVVDREFEIHCDILDEVTDGDDEENA